MTDALPPERADWRRLRELCERYSLDAASPSRTTVAVTMLKVLDAHAALEQECERLRAELAEARGHLAIAQACGDTFYEQLQERRTPAEADFDRQRARLLVKVSEARACAEAAEAEVAAMREVVAAMREVVGAAVAWCEAENEDTTGHLYDAVVDHRARAST